MSSRAPLRSACGYPLLQSKGTASYYVPANQYVNRVGSSTKRTRGEVIDVLAVAYAEVRSVVRCQQVRALVDWPRDRTCGASERDCRQGQLASCDATDGECELNRYDAAVNVKHTRSIGIDGLLNLRAVRLNHVDACRAGQPRDQRGVFIIVVWFSFCCLGLVFLFISPCFSGIWRSKFSKIFKKGEKNLGTPRITRMAQMTRSGRGAAVSSPPCLVRLGKKMGSCLKGVLPKSPLAKARKT
jgi:hypothetical protein